MSGCHCPTSCCADPDITDKKGPPVFAKQIGAFTDQEEPVPDSVLAVQDSWYRPQAEKQLPEPDERLRQEIGSFSLTFENAEGYSVLLAPEEARRKPDPGTPKTADTDRLAALLSQLQRAEQEAARRRIRVRVPTLTGGCCFIIAAIVLLMLLQTRRDGSAALLVFPYVAAFAICAQLGSGLLLLSVLPSDQRILRCLRLLFGCVAIPSGAYITHLGASTGLDNDSRSIDCAYSNIDVACWVSSAVAISDMASGLIIVCFACCAFLDQLCDPGVEATRMLKRLYAAAGFVWIAVGVFSFMTKHSVLIHAGPVGELYLHVIAVAVGLVLVLFGAILAHPRFRRRVQISLSQSKASTVGSGLHELLGGRGMDEVIADGQNSFRAIPADRVHLEHFMVPVTGLGNSELCALSEPAQFGFVDAFISYSWQDSASAQWFAIQRWRDDFKQAHKREPLLWIDRYCLHSSEAEAAAMMPTYIAGCQKFLSLAGSQYLDSLQNLVELFVFGELGRMPEELYEMLLLQDAESRGQMHGWIASLNVWNAHDTCGALLRARESASGRDGFEDKVKRILYVGLDHARVHRDPITNM